MNADAYYENGINKSVCQDYTLAGNYKDMYYAIGSDGCSSSPDTDVGSRLLALTGRSVCVKNWGSFPKENFFHMVEYLIFLGCDNLRYQLNVSPSVFDATLWIAICPPTGKIIIMGWGDGVVIADYDIYKLIYKYEYQSNAPFYLSYKMKDREKDYQQQFGSLKILEKVYKIYADSFYEILSRDEHDYIKPFYKEFDRDGLKAISICSDGVNTYTDENNTPLFMPHIMMDFLAYKNVAGEFVKRKMKKLKKDYEKKGITHWDDVFCSTILLKDCS